MDRCESLCMVLRGAMVGMMLALFMVMLDTGSRVHLSRLAEASSQRSQEAGQRLLEGGLVEVTVPLAELAVRSGDFRVADGWPVTVTVLQRQE